jgi:holo-[acyl-carrier protein] synthase
MWINHEIWQNPLLLNSSFSRIGVDIVDIARFEAAVNRVPRLAERILTEYERGQPIASQAARFAAKEALAKALKAPRGLRWKDVEVLKGPANEPLLRITGTVAAEAQRQGVTQWQVSLAHDGGYAIAVVLGIGSSPAETL